MIQAQKKAGFDVAERSMMQRKQFESEKSENECRGENSLGLLRRCFAVAPFVLFLPMPGFGITDFP